MIRVDYNTWEITSWPVFFLKTVVDVWINKVQEQMNNYKLILGIEFHYGNAFNWIEKEIVLHQTRITAMQPLPPYISRDLQQNLKN